jgi:hypothetical protein
VLFAKILSGRYNIRLPAFDNISADAKDLVAKLLKVLIFGITVFGRKVPVPEKKFIFS